MKMNKKLKHIFKDDGNFRFPYDPFRYTDKDRHFHSQIFDEDGDVHFDVAGNIYEELKNRQYAFNSDIMMVYYANEFACNTKGNYTAIYLWR